MKEADFCSNLARKKQKIKPGSSCHVYLTDLVAAFFCSMHVSAVTFVEMTNNDYFAPLCFQSWYLQRSSPPTPNPQSLFCECPSGKAQHGHFLPPIAFVKTKGKIPIATRVLACLLLSSWQFCRLSCVTVSVSSNRSICITNFKEKKNNDK